MASTPPNAEVGFSQLSNGSPLPAEGTRPGAIAPATAPKKTGVTTEDAANAAPAARCWLVRTDTLRNAKADPRNTIPSAARPSGRYKVVMTAKKADGKAVHSTTRQ